jgi:hypothetical protein
MTWSELNDWLALYDIDPWGEQRADLRSSVNALLTNGVRDVEVLFPYVGQPDSDEISVEDEAELIATLSQMNQAQTDGPRTAESKTDRVG